MSRATTAGGRRARAVFTAIAVGAAALLAQPVSSAEFGKDGWIQAHGFVEGQVRALSENYSEEFDLAQWYNVINLELEFDIAPDGFGPVDLLSAYVRVEGRYDAIYNNAMWLFPSVNTYGDQAENLPRRLRDAVDKEYGGTIPTVDRFGDFEHRRIEDRDPAALPPEGERLGFPGVDTFFRLAGPDNVIGPLPADGRMLADNQAAAAANMGVVQLRIESDDPARYVHEDVLNFRFTYKETRGPANTDTQILGPWLPRNFIRAQALTRDRGNPFRGRLAAARGRILDGFSIVNDPGGVRHFEGDINGPDIVPISVDPMASATVDVLDPLLQELRPASDMWPGLEVFAPSTVLLNIEGLPLENFFPASFGGDFMGGVVPCVDPTNDDFAEIRDGTGTAPSGARCIRGSTDTATGELYTDPNVLGLTEVTGGAAENPFRPGPDVGNLGSLMVVNVGTADDPIYEVVEGSRTEIAETGVPQGLFIPSKGNQRLLASGDLDKLDFNYDEIHRSFNRGQSQDNNKEIKEAYFDIELLESRLWIRAGLQNIVWGKTELFRTTDQFNPQDLALASLPSLEESRIALWSARFVYSLYDVGPLEDVRLEFAANIDQYQPADLGACGEPFTPDIVCSLTTGIYAHSLLGVGVAGIDRPESPWKEIEDLEFGGRIEWRWDRFSFALTDFYGFSDFPFADAIFFYDRAVDYETGRPLAAILPGQALGSCGNVNAGELATNLANGATYSTSFASHPLSMTVGAPSGGPRGITQYRGGIGRDSDCLRPGGAVGFANQFQFGDATEDLNGDGLVDGDDDDILLTETNALYNHSANQQLFHWICASTISIAATLDAGACAWTIFSSEAQLNEQLLPVPFVELATPVFAGEATGGGAGPQAFLSLTQNSQKAVDADVTAPLVSLNALPNPATAPIYDRNGDGLINSDGCDGLSTPALMALDPTSTPEELIAGCDLGGWDGFDTRVTAFGTDVVIQTLDMSLTNEQRALLGCGPFFGTRCDTSVLGDIYNRTGGLDFLNMEASALVQAWPGFEGTVEGHTTTAALPRAGVVNPDALYQPGTVGFVGGPVCTRFSATSPDGLVKLPGCRGVSSLEVLSNASGPVAVDVVFEDGYLPEIDGCVIGHQIRRSVGTPVAVAARYASGADASELNDQLELCSTATVRRPVSEFSFNGILADGTPAPQTPNPACVGQSGGGTWDLFDHSFCNGETVTLEELPLIHPLAGCIESDVWIRTLPGRDGGSCAFFYARDYVSEFLDGTAALFQNELAAFSWNFLMLLTVTSCNNTSIDLDGLNHDQGNPLPDGGFAITAEQALRADPNCFDFDRPYTEGRCSYTSPQFCTNVRGFLAAAGVQRNERRAGGSDRYGRRTFAWHGGGELAIRYEQRNVLGLATDFAEDVSKTNWGVEFTWIEGVPFTDNDSLTGVTKSDTFNLTVSIDRPTFINFLNPNRTFFFNTQWFFQYVPEFNKGFTAGREFNTLFTLAMFTGYFQDRVMPTLVTVYDFNSQSGGVLPSLMYRFTESFSVTVGGLYFFGRTELDRMPVQPFAPPSNRVGENAYRVPVDNVLSAIRKRDEIFLRLRMTF